jgi:hypothetical protein
MTEMRSKLWTHINSKSPQLECDYRIRHADVY